MKPRKSLSLLGSTGSIGKNVLNVVRSFPDRFQILGLSAGRNIKELAAQVQEFQPACISVADQEGAAQLTALLPAQYKDKIFWGDKGNEQVATIP
ncbi:MAG: 1-deoxy-D-xylulose-5-phosphate reductoisomerase, partial [Candidatus Electrothrix sp. AUS3]|nr:1-deoxy-D-xylulose-5-phosphate reductoisomerase [Candidatus Electrothrix gigas]